MRRVGERTWGNSLGPEDVSTMPPGGMVL